MIKLGFPNTRTGLIQALILLKAKHTQEDRTFGWGDFLFSKNFL